jgi:hypothetical protein
MNLKALIFISVSSALALSVAQTDNATKFPSPDGKFAMQLSNQAQGGKQIQLVEVSSGKVVVDLGDAPYPRANDCRLLWSPDSQRVAFYGANQRGGDTTVYFRSESKFSESPLPELGICATATQKKELKAEGINKFIEFDTAPKKWLKSGALVLMNTQGWETNDGDLRGCTQTVTIAFDARHKASILRVADKKPKDY